MTQKSCCCCLSKLKAVAVYLCSLMLCGCSTPQVIGEFKGLRSMQGADDHLHIILVHGIGKHEPGWSGGFYRKLRASLNLVKVVAGDWDKCIFISANGSLTEPDRCVDSSEMPRNVEGVLKSIVLQTADNKTVTITEITWSPITTALKQKLLAYDKESDLSKKRVWVNKGLREDLVDDGFSDALAYLGEPGERIRKIVWQGICYSMTGKLNSSEACDSGMENFSGEPHRFAFITHSLGSRVVFDALHAGDEEKLHAAKYKATTQVVSNTVAIYMLANQLPLLEMGSRPESVESVQGFTAAGFGMAGSLNRFLEERKQIQSAPSTLLKKGERPPISIAAFSDPNDLLSYSLCKADIPHRDDVKFADIWVKNAINVLGLFANPQSAHNGYWTNEEVINLLVGGDVAGKRMCGTAADDQGE